MIDNRTINVFVAHSPFQAFVANHMTARMTEFGASDNLLIVDSPTGPMESGAGKWTRTVRLEPPVGPSVRRAGPRLRDALLTVSDLIRNYSLARLFIANVQWPLNNVLFGKWPTLADSTEGERCNYPEGIGSLRLVYPDWRQKGRDRFKNLLGIWSGVRYQPIKCDLMGLTVCDRIYSLMPRLLPSMLKDKVVAIPPFEASGQRVRVDTCLFLGQFDRAVPSAQRRVLAQCAASICSRQGYARYIYKPHHYRESAEQRDVFLNQGFELLDDPRPIEELLADSPVACVASFVSSALVHLKMMFGDSIRCLACCPEDFGRFGRMNRGQEQGMIDIFKQCGVEIIPGLDSEPYPGSGARP